MIRTRRNHRNGWMSAAALGALALPPAAFAQAPAPGQVEELVVTAQKREQNVQDVGISITALSGAQLERLGVLNTQRLPDLTPGLRSEAAGAATTNFTIRGVGQRDIADQNEAAVVVFTDGAYVSWLAAAGAPIYDAGRVEVLKGPQGTLFGRNATGGLISIINNKPTDRFGGYAAARAGSYGQWGVEGAVGGPIAEGISGRLSLLTDRFNGYDENLAGADKASMRNYNGRAQLLFKPSDKLQFLLNGRVTLYDPAESTGLKGTPTISTGTEIRSPASAAEFGAYCRTAFAAAPLFGYALAPPGSERSGNCFIAQSTDPHTGTWNSSKFWTKLYGTTGTLDWKLSEQITLTSITDYQQILRKWGSSSSGTPFNGLFDYTQNLHAQQVSQELRLAGNFDRFRWVAGGYYLRISNRIANITDLINNPAYLIRANALYTTYTKSYAAFAQGEYDLTPELTVTAGGRWTHDRKTLSNHGTCDSNPLAFGAVVPGFSQCNFLKTFVFAPTSVQFAGFDGGFSKGDWSGKLQLDYRPKDGVLLYAGVNRGIKAGGFNSGGGQFYPASAVIYQPERLMAYEAGFKTTLLNRTATLNGAVFYYDYKNYQSYLSLDGFLRVLNVDARAKGAELELVTRPTAGLQFRLAGTWMDSRELDVPTATGPRDYPLPDAPRWSLNALARDEWPLFGGTAAIQADAAYVSRRTDNAIDIPVLRLPAYVRANARVSYTTGDGRWTATAWVDNLTDKKVVSVRVDGTNLIGSTFDTYDRPRWFGGSITYRLGP
jgi:iron complex outermembrane receptor protein